MNPYFVGLLVPIAVSLLLKKRRNVEKKRGLPVDVGGEPGYAIRNYRFEHPVETHWEGVSTLAELFEQSCKEFVYMPLLGTRKLISRETELASDGRSFEKLHLGEYEWKCYAEAFKSVCNFSSGLIRLGHQSSECVAIFAETLAEWQIALQVLEGIMEAEGGELEILIGLSSQISSVIPNEFAQELEHGQIKKRFVKRLVDVLNANMKPTAHCPGMRRVIIEQAIYMMEYNSHYVNCFKDCWMMEALSMVERTPTKAEKYRLFLGDLGLMEYSTLMSNLVTRAKQLMAVHST